MTIRPSMLLGLALSLAGACSSTGSLTDGGPGGAAGGGQSGAGGSGGGGTGGAATTPTTELSGIAYGNGTFVAAGIDLQNPLLWTGVIYASADGATWTKVASGLSGETHDVKFGNGKFVAVASNISDSGVYPATAFVSDDGQTWTMTRELPERMVAQRIAFGAGSFVTAGMQSHVRSTDGVTWAAFGPAAASYLASEVDFAAGHFVSWTLGATSVAVYDGNAWSTGALPDTQYKLADVRVVNDSLVAITRYDCCVGEQPDAIRWGTASSADGSSWAATQTGLFERPPQIVHDSGTLCIAIRDFDVLSGDSCNSLAVTFHDGTFRPEAALHAGGVFVVSGMGGLLSSTDGRVWTKRL